MSSWRRRRSSWRLLVLVAAFSALFSHAASRQVDGPAAAAATAASAAPAVPRRSLLANATTGGGAAGSAAARGASGGGGGAAAAAASGGSAATEAAPAQPAAKPAATPRRPAAGKCSPSMLQVARGVPSLQQVVQLAASGFDMFAVDGGKPFTLLAPSDDALQALAAGVEDPDQRRQLQQGFYSIVLYSQLPEGAWNVTQLSAKGDGNLQTGLTRAVRGTTTLSFNNRTTPLVATGGWPANNAQLLESYPACDGWLHVMGAVLQPSQQISDLPRLVQAGPDLPPDAFWKLLDGSAAAESGAGNGTAVEPEPTPEAEAPVPAPPTHGGGSTALVVSGGAGGGTTEPPPELSSSSSGSSSTTILIVAASCAGAAVAACAAVVAIVVWRKRAAKKRRARRRHDLPSTSAAGEGILDEDGVARSKGSMLRPVQLHVDA